jgi:hypothetical protein
LRHANNNPTYSHCHRLSKPTIHRSSVWRNGFQADDNDDRLAGANAYAAFEFETSVPIQTKHSLTSGKPAKNSQICVHLGELESLESYPTKLFLLLCSYHSDTERFGSHQLVMQ